MKKKLYTGMLIGAFCLMQAVSAQAGWQQDETGIRYQREDETFPQREWLLIDGNWYYFDQKGYVQQGWRREGKNLYLLGIGGAMVTGRDIKIGDDYYRIDENGLCSKLPGNYSGWLKYDEGFWYREADGSYPVNAWREVQGSYYHFDENGYLQTGWFFENGKSYWLGMDGVMVSNVTIPIDGIEYTFDETGAALSRFKQPTVILPEEEKTEMMHTVDALADQILAGIINDNMSESQKAAAIYSWIRGNLAYGASGTIGDWPQAAYEGLRRRRGNCYTYYATSLALLSRAGIPSIEVIRSTDNDHWWNLVYVDGNWYHFDTTPRAAGGNFCLLTTAQLMNYSNGHRNSHVFDQSLYPPTP